MKAESQNIEYKESWNDKYLQWICGFANAQGGKIYIGVNDERSIIGVKDSKRLMEDIPNKIVNYLGIVADVNLKTEEDKEYIEIIVSPSSMPVAYKGIYHYRSGSTKQELKGLALQDFILKKMRLSWDDVAVEEATFEDIDRGAIEYFLQKAMAFHRMPEGLEQSSSEHVLRSLNLITDDGHIKQAAILLFGKAPNHYILSCDFRIGRFTISESDLTIQDIVTGNLIQMPDKIMELLRSKYLVSPISYSGLQRIEPLEIPEEALREAICNAIIHKDYSGVHIQMRVFNDRVELWNPGNLPEEISIESLNSVHASIPRNRNIANVFYRAGFIESWGRGINKIQTALRAAHLKDAEFTSEFGGVKITIHRDIEWLNENVYNIIANHVGGNKTDMLAVMKLTDKQREILSCIEKEATITAKRLAAMAAMSQRSVERELANLQKMGVIQHVGAPRTGKWIIVKQTNE